MKEKSKTDLIAGIGTILVLLVFTLFFFNSLKSGIEKEEKRECLQWQKLSQELRSDLFFLTPMQKKQCDVYGFKINAPVNGGG